MAVFTYISTIAVGAKMPGTALGVIPPQTFVEESLKVKSPF